MDLVVAGSNPVAHPRILDSINKLTCYLSNAWVNSIYIYLMTNMLNSGLIKKSIPYLIILGVGMYAGISIVRYKPHLFYLSQIPMAQVEAIALSEKVGKLMSLPTDEQPIIETVTDLTLLKDKPFFVKAEIGDKVLIYEKAAMAILYRPSKNIMINTLSPNYEEAIFSTPSLIPSPVATIIPTLDPTPTPTIPTPTLEATIATTPAATPSATPKI